MKRPSKLPMDDRDAAPVRQMALTQNLTLEGFSRAAVQTYFRLPEAGLLLDCGAVPSRFASSPNLALSHAHADHIGGLISYIAARSIQRTPPPRIFVPEAIRKNLHRWIEATEALQNDKHHCELIGMAPGDKQALSKTLLLKAVPTMHSVPSLGYQLLELRHHLKPEYRKWSEEEIARARQGGAEVDDPVEYPLLAYTGDTASECLSRPEFLESEVLICEMSFISEEDEQAAVKYGHVALRHAAEVLQGFKGHTLVFSHFSTRYDYRQIVSQLEKMLAPELLAKTVIWV